MDIKTAFNVALVKSLKSSPTNEAVMAKKLLESKGSVSVKLIPKARGDVKFAKLSVVQEGELSYLKLESKGKSQLYMSPMKEAKTMLEELEDSKEDSSKVASYLADNAVLLADEKPEVADPENDYTITGTYDTPLGVFVLVGIEENAVTLMDSDDELVTMDYDDWDSLSPTLIQMPGQHITTEPLAEPIANMNNETTQVGDIATPMGSLTPGYKAFFKKRGVDGTIVEESLESDDPEQFNTMCTEAEADKNFIEFTDFITPDDEVVDENEDLFSDKDESYEVLGADGKPKQNSGAGAITIPPALESANFKVGKTYDTDMGKLIITKISKGLVSCKMVDGSDKYDIELAEFELLHPIMEESSEEDSDLWA